MHILRNLVRREFLTTIAAGLAQVILPSYSHGQETADISLEIADKNYEPELLAFNLRNPGNLSLNSNGNLYFVHRTDDYDEGVFEIADGKINYRFPPLIRLGKSVRRTKIESSQDGYVFIYQSNGSEDCLMVFRENGEKRFELRNQFLEKYRISLYPVKDLAVNPLDNKLYIPLEEKIEIFDPDSRGTGKGTLEEWASKDRTRAACFDRKGNLYMITDFIIDRIGEKEKFKISKIDKNKKVSEVELKSPLAVLKGRAFTFYNLTVDPTDQNLVISGELMTRDRDYGCLIKFDVYTGEAWPVAIAINKSISGLEIGKKGDIYVSLSKTLIAPNNQGMIVALRKKWK